MASDSDFSRTALPGDPAGDTPADYGDAAAEYRAARESAALFPRRSRGRLRLTGSDALDLLHRTTTADLASLPVGGVATTVVQSETARVLDWVTVLRRADDLVLIGGAGRGAALAEWIDRLVIMEDVQVEALGDDSELFEIVGPSAGAALADAWGAEAGAIPAGRAVLPAPAPGVTLIRGFERRPDAWLVLFEAGADRGPLERLVAERRLVPAGLRADEALRIEDGRPLVGRELNGDANPLEARLEDSVSFTKGCYPGQEVVARLITYKSLKRRLARFELDRDVPPPPPGTNYPAVDGGAPTARITSTARSFAGVPVIALGYVKNELAAPGTDIVFSAPDGPVRGRVLDIPPAP
jgi:folate-binding protein YgfZ